MSKIPRSKYNPWIFLGLIVISSSVLFFHNLGSSYITHWDEVVQLNVVKNLSENCCTPKLHLQDYNTDFRNWTDNYVWLHKPPMPLFVNAGFFKVFGQNLWTFRLPNVVFIELAIVLLFIIGKKYFGNPNAIISTCLFAFNRYTFELVQGRQFSGISDIMLVLFLLCALYFILKIAENPQRKYFIWFGVVSGLAFLCKDGLALMPFLVLLIFILAKDGPWPWQNLKPRTTLGPQLLNFCYAVLLCLALIAAEKIYFAFRFPYQSTYESQVQLAHIYLSVEYWGRPWYFYFKDYWKVLFGAFVGIIGYLALFYNLLKSKRDNKLFILSTWVFCYLFLLSFMVSKISNFLYPAVPVVYLLLGAAISDIWKKISFQKILKLITIIFILFVTGRSITTSLQSASARATDYQSQIGLKQASLGIKNKLPIGSVILVDWQEVDKSHLFLKYWSDYEAFEIYYYHPAWDWLSLLVGQKNIYLISDKPYASYGPLVSRVGLGYLYKLR